MAPRPQVVGTPRVPRIGPYSQVMRVGGLLFTAGQPGIDPATGVPAGDTFEAQARQALRTFAPRSRTPAAGWSAL